MATPDLIPTDMTLEIDLNLSPEKFIAAAKAFFGYVQEVGKSVTGEENIQWVVSVKKGSNLLAIDTSSATPIDAIGIIYSKVLNGMISVKNGNIDDARLTEQALKHLKILSELTENKHGIAPIIRLWVNRKPTVIDGDIASHIREDWRTDYKDFGTFEGRLESIQDTNGALRLQIRDALMRQTIPCYFQEEMLSSAFEMFRKRVEVSGTIHYRKNGKAISIEVSGIEKLPEDDDLPSASDVRGIFGQHHEH